jgi:hypothetical protein
MVCREWIRGTTYCVAALEALLSEIPRAAGRIRNRALAARGGFSKRAERTALL